GLTEVKTETLTATNSVTVGSGNTKAELLNSGLTFTGVAPATNSKTIYGNDGLKFTDGGDTAAEGTTRITRDKIGFANDAGSLDTNKPHLTKDGINAGNQKISNIADGDSDNDAINKKQLEAAKTELQEKLDETKGTANSALQTFTVKKHDATAEETITVGKDDKPDGTQVNTLTLKGENGLTVATKKADGTI
ncbi:hypothetical protein, partial [Moraxella catarrhalis]|uniref:hypothetical protein n=1 Tax=Moraxella catarrhalis TaxID=480 RepID=UPI000AD28891